MAKKEFLYVYSTLATDMNYTNYAEGGADLPVPLPAVFIKGGAGVANDRLVTPRGVVTQVTEDELAYLEANQVFQLHKQNGYIMVEKSKLDPEKVAADMTGRDNSAPMVVQDVPADQLPKKGE
jgi:hypothetical protein